MRRACQPCLGPFILDCTADVAHPTPDDSLWFGRYRLTSRIATGGMAEVYVGRLVSPEGRFGSLVAVKRLLPHLAKESHVVRMFLNEARIMAQIDHPNVVRILDLGQQNGEPYIAMELLEGRSFSELRMKAGEAGRHVPLGITLRVLADACRGLDAAHRAVDDQGRPLYIVHRDFTPDNIHVGVKGDVKVIDFGIAKTQQWGTGTEPGTLKGKYFYMSPEMILGQEVDHRADLFAAGVMLYEQLCGRRPFTGTSSKEVVDAIALGRPKRPKEFNPAVPTELEEICLKAIRRNPQERFPSLQEFIAALESLHRQVPLADRSEVGAYVSELFPAGEDQRRKTLRFAREADPSVPGTMTPPGGSPEVAPPVAVAPPEVQAGRPLVVAAQDRGPAPGVRASTTASEETTGPAEALDRQAVAAPTEGLPGGAPRTSRRSSWKVVAAALAALFAGFGALGFWLVTPRMSVDERLRAASASPARLEREQLLVPLADGAGADEAALSSAVNMLLEVEANEAALRLAQRLAERFPQSLEAALLEARAATRLRMGKRAEAAIERARSLDATGASIQPDLALASLRELQGEWMGAIEALGQALKKSPGSRVVLARKGYLLSQNGRLDEAATVLSELLQGGFEPASAAELAFVRFRQEKTEEAAGLLKKALKKEPALAVGHYYLGAVLYRENDVKGAERAYREADRLIPEDARALLALCQMQAQQKDPRVDETKKAFAARFPADAARLGAECQ